MKLNTVLAATAMVAATVVAGPAFAQTAPASGDFSAQLSDAANTNTGYASAALLLAAPAAIGIAYLSGTIRGMIGWGKSRKG